MTVRQLIPEGLARMAPGPELATALAGLDVSRLSGADLVEVLRARARQLSHEQAQFLAVVAEVGWCDPMADHDEVARLAQAPEHAADEIRAALACTRSAAYREHHFAQTLRGRMPAVFAALNDGTICRSKAWLFTELCAALTDEQIQVVCDRLLPQAGKLTTGELAARIKKLAIALDPEWAARRYTTAVRNRDVIGYLDEDGTATVTGRQLPANQAAAACARIEDLAKAAKRAGCPGRIGALRADIYLGLLDGRWAHHTREQIIADLLADAGTTAETARTLVAAQYRAKWRFAITDSDGHLLLAGVTRHRPDRPDSGNVTGGSVELHIPAALLGELVAKPDASGTTGHWATVIADLAAQYRRFQAAGSDADATTVSRQHPSARFAGVALRRHIEIRDRVCVYPGCRCPACDADLDHTVDHAQGGQTTEANIGPVCRHDHGLKHGGWQLHQPEPGHFVWTSPLGRTYRTRPQPISDDLPDPVPRRHYPDQPAPPPDDEGPILHRPPPTPPKPPPPPAPATDPDEPRSAWSIPARVSRTTAPTCSPTSRAEVCSASGPSWVTLAGRHPRHEARPPPLAGAYSSSEAWSGRSPSVKSSTPTQASGGGS